MTITEDHTQTGTSTTMRVVKRDGRFESVDVNKIVRAVEGFIQATSRDRPVVVWIDAMQWVDIPSPKR